MSLVSLWLVQLYIILKQHLIITMYTQPHKGLSALNKVEKNNTSIKSNLLNAK